MAAVLGVALWLPTTAALAKSEKDSAKVDINSASLKDLESLPGVGPATAKKIVAGRPYASVAELSRAGVPASTIEKVKSLVVVASSRGGGASAAAPPVAVIFMF